MSNLVGVLPTDITKRIDSFMFYYGVKSKFVNQLPANAVFSVVYSPIEDWGWEFVRYQVFQELNGLMVLERRILEADEIAYFELIIATSKL